jgi:hypothetical protein
MKVYVDELHIKNCSCCDFCYSNSQGCVCKLTGHITRYDEPLEEMRSKCPLLSLTDHDKQVRKEVCEEIYNKIVDIIEDGDSIKRRDLMHVLNKI